MITNAQNKEILNYLTSRKLPTDLILELKDHFITQISKKMEEENLSFDESFIKTKMLWENDLKMRRRSFFSFEKLPEIAIKYQRQENLNILKGSFLITVLLLIVHVFSTRILEKEYYFILNAPVYFFMNVLLPISIVLTYFTINLKTVFVHQAAKIYRTQIPVVTVLLLVLTHKTWYLPTNSFEIAFDFINFKAFDLYVFFASIVKIALNYFTFIYLYQIMSRRWKENFKLKKLLA